MAVKCPNPLSENQCSLFSKSLVRVMHFFQPISSVCSNEVVKTPVCCCTTLRVLVTSRVTVHRLHIVLLPCRAAIFFYDRMSGLGVKSCVSRDTQLANQVCVSVSTLRIVFFPFFFFWPRSQPTNHKGQRVMINGTFQTVDQPWSLQSCLFVFFSLAFSGVLSR